jgi:hypothetical protein
MRIGLYLQAIALLLSMMLRLPPKTTLLPFATLQTAILAILCVQCNQNALSPAEVLIAGNLVEFVCLISSILLIAADPCGQGLSISLMTMNSLWGVGFMMWFWGRGYRTLPDLGTQNAAFFWMQVALDGWFLALPFVIAGAEKEIQWNGLVPSEDWSSLAQLVPFLIGLVGLLDVGLMAFRVFNHGQREKEEELERKRNFNLVPLSEVPTYQTKNG